MNTKPQGEIKLLGTLCKVEWYLDTVTGMVGIKNKLGMFVAKKYFHQMKQNDVEALGYGGKPNRGGSSRSKGPSEIKVHGKLGRTM